MPQTIHEIGCKMAEYFKGHEVFVATHVDSGHKHNHLIINSVNMDTGKKIQLGPGSIYDIRKFSDEICREYGLSIVEPQSQGNKSINTREYRSAVKGKSWKFALMNAIDMAIEVSPTKANFIVNMRNMGYQVNWQESHKYITYTTPDGMKCRDKRLHDEKYLKVNMEEYYAKHRQTQGTEQTRKPITGIQHEVKSVRDTTTAFGRFAENAVGYSNGTGSHAGAYSEAPDLEQYRGQSQSRFKQYEKGSCGGGQPSVGFGKHTDTKTNREFDTDRSGFDYDQCESSGEYTQSQRFNTSQAPHKVGGDWCDIAGDILYIAKNIEGMVTPYNDSEKKKQPVRKSKKHSKKRTYNRDYEPKM
jgi:hypothetical protein